jgi:hypothetical protein
VGDCEERGAVTLPGALVGVLGQPVDYCSVEVVGSGMELDDVLMSSLIS